MNDEDVRIIEINGVKLEVDLRTAKRVDQFRIGDPVKILVKEYDSFKSYPGVIIGFDDFTERPTIIIAYVKVDYNGAELQFVYLNKDSKDIELCPTGSDEIAIDKAGVVEAMDRQILDIEEKLRQAKAKKKYFLDKFNRYFYELSKEEATK